MQAARTNANKLDITTEFVRGYSARYEKYHAGTKLHEDEQCLKTWLAQQSGPKFLDKKHFVDIACWKSPRARRHYEANPEDFVREVTQLAFQQSDDRLSLHILMALDGVGMPVASPLLTFAF